MIKSLLTLFFAFFFSLFLNAQELRWTPSPGSATTSSTIKPAEFDVYQIDFDELKTFLSQAPHRENVMAKNSDYIFSIPSPGGENWDFKIVESPVMAPGLQAEYSEIRTFIGQGIGEHAHATARFDYTLKGFHGQVLVAGETFYIDPYNEQSLDLYIVYTRKAFYAASQKVMATCDPQEAVGLIELEPSNQKQIENPNFINLSEIDIPEAATTNGSNLRTYRLALACTGEYANYHGGTVALVMSAFTTSMNRVNGVFVRDMSLEMIMVEDNDDLIYLNSSTDPYSNGNGGSMLGQNQTTCNSVIGSSNYDIGHVFSTGGGGVAYLQSVCGSNKAGGVTGQSNPEGDPFDIDYVAHEMGHQWGGNHTQNNSCNRSTNAAYEPGSASTIMGYAGICSPNLQNNSDDHFNNHSYNEMYNFSVTGNGNNCAVTTPSGNTPPTLTVRPSNFFIPIETPFELTATGNDVNGDALTYCWEQHDLGPATSSSDNDLTDPSGNAPIFRSWSPTTNDTRVFPRLFNLVNNSSVIGELLPTYSRDLTFRCTVRDNSAGGGGVTDDEVAFEATASAGPFLVTSPNSGVSWIGNSGQTVTWNVANTNSAPVNCSQVDIFMSTDGGYTYPFQLASNVPNDGSETIVVPNISTSQARIKVKASDNIFFDISNQNFSIQPGIVNDLDAAITSIDEPSGDVCGTSVTPEITIMNFGLDNLTSVEIIYDLNGSNTMFYTWTGNLAPNQSTSVTLSQISASGGNQTLNVILINPNGQPDENGSNNAASISFDVVNQTGESLPVSNDFNSGFPGTGWDIENPDGGITWENASVTNDIDCNSSSAATINFYSYNSSGETDDLVSPLIDLNESTAPEITFDYAYKRYSASYNDRMQVQIKTGCDESWTTLWDKENLELATAGSQTSPFTPSCGDWESQSIDISAFQGNIVQIRFRGITGYGNNLYLDNISVSDEAPVCGPGFFVDGSSCLECPPGTYCPGDGNSYPCAAGTYQSVSGATFCLSCEAGSYSDITGATECQLCPAGTYQGQSGAIECFDCAAGTISDPGATECDFCPAGYYVDGNECSECPPGTYCPGDGNSYPCAAGTYQSVSGATFCLSCEAGSFSDIVGATECQLCPAGTYQGQSGAIECFDCAAGTNSGPGAIECQFVDCNGVTGGNAYEDECGVCDDIPSNDNDTCLDCAGVPNGSAYIDECGVCDDIPSNDNDTCLDCAGVPNGSSYTDECGVCDDMPSNDNDTCLDCAGVPNGSAYIDECGVCDDIPSNDNDTCLDCAGVPNGSSYTDECGVCDDMPSNDNDTCLDCAGVPNGSAYIDECGVCDDIPSNDNDTCLDCAGVPNGSAYLDDCGICSGGTTEVEPCILGCMSPTSCNFNSEATVDDGSCIEPVENCYVCNENNDGLILIDGDDDGICDAEETILTATFEDGAPNCTSLDVEIWVYEANTSNILNILTTVMNDGSFSTELNLPAGTYDIYIKVNSYLSKGYYNTAIGLGGNLVMLSEMISGDVNGNDGINITDFSILNGAFNSLAGDDNYNPNADLNCDGGVNIVDVSILNQGFNQIGDHAALLNP